MEAQWWQHNYTKSQCVEVYGWQYILILERKKELYTKWNACNEQTGLIAQTHILNVASHCKNKKIDEAVQKSSANKQSSLKPLTVRGNNTQALKCRNAAALPGMVVVVPVHTCEEGAKSILEFNITEGGKHSTNNINGNSKQQRVTFAWSQSAC